MIISKKIKIGLLLGIIAGVIDVAPMIIKKLPLEANLSAFVMWFVVGLFMPLIDIKAKTIFKNILKGIGISFLMVAPVAILVAFAEPKSLIPIGIMTLVLGSFLGFSSYKLIGKG